MSSIDNSDTDNIHSYQNDTPSEVKLMIRHQFPGIELLSPTYASRNARCCLRPEQRVNAGSTMKASFEVNPDQDESISILMCKLERTNIDELNEGGGSCIQHVMIWKIDKLKRFRAITYLIEHDKSRIWDRDELMKLVECHNLFDIQHVPIEKTWLIYNNIVLMTKMDVTREGGCFKLEMNLSEESIGEDTQRPQYIGLNK
jgi:hypothetical protein